MKKIILIAIVAICGMMCPAAQAQVSDTYRNQVKEMFELSGVAQSFPELLYTQLKAPLASLNLSDSEMMAMCREVTKTVMPDVLAAMCDACSSIYTLDDLKNINAFYSTPTGKKMAANQAKLQEKMTSAMLKPEVQAKIIGVVKRYID